MAPFNSGSPAQMPKGGAPKGQRAIDILTPKVDFEEELKRGNVAVGLFVAAIFVSVAIVIGGALN